MEKLDFILFKGKVVFPEDSSYEESRMCWNRGIDKKPSVIAYCRDVEDIKLCLKIAKDKNLPFRIRSGAHHYEGFSTGDNIFVIDVSEINQIDINLEKNTIKIQAGTRNREVYETAGEYDIPFPGGGCPTVGAVGYTLGGGWGYSARYLGLGIDSLLSAEILDYRGEILRVSDAENKDLFWALKGAGSGTFGVVISMTFKLPKKEKLGTLVVSELTNASIDQMQNIFKAWDKSIEKLDPRLNMKVAFYNDSIKGQGIKIIGIFYGNELEALTELKKITLDYKWEYSLKEMSILDINRWIQDNHPDYEKYKSAGRFVKESYKLYEIKEMLEILLNRPKESIYTAISLYGMGGNIKNISEDKNSFYYRNTKGILGFQVLWEEDTYKNLNKEWLIKNSEVIKKLTKGSFVNFPLKELENYMEEYFGENKYKLKRIKEKYDPNNFFNFEQGII